MNQIKSLIQKLSSYYWMGKPKYKYTAGSEGLLNLLWLALGCPKQIEKHQLQGSCAYVVSVFSRKEVEGYTINEWATLLQLDEFSDFIEEHAEVFEEFADVVGVDYLQPDYLKEQIQKGLPA